MTELQRLVPVMSIVRNTLAKPRGALMYGNHIKCSRPSYFCSFRFQVVNQHTWFYLSIRRQGNINQHTYFIYKIKQELIQMWIGLTWLGFLADWFLVLGLVLAMHSYLQVFERLLLLKWRILIFFKMLKIVFKIFLSSLLHTVFFFNNVPRKTPATVLKFICILCIRRGNRLSEGDRCCCGMKCSRRVCQ